jgi:anti-anti-sigma regulatory factor
VAGCEEPPVPLHARWPAVEPGTLVLVVTAPVTHGNVGRLCLGVRWLIRQGLAERVVCDVGALVDPDATTVDALARVRLTARRLGCEVRLRNASPRLRELLALVGLSDVLPCDPGSGLDRQSEEREQVLGVEEGVDPGDTPV